MKDRKDRDLSVFDFDGDIDATPRPRFLEKLRESFCKRSRKSGSTDELWRPADHRSRTARVLNPSPVGIGSRTRNRVLQQKNENVSDAALRSSTKGVLPVRTYRNVVQLEESEGKRSREQSMDRRWQHEEAEEGRLLQESLSMSRLHVLVFPQDDPDAVTITTEDIEMLRPSGFLNDTIIDFYMKYLQTTLSPKEKERSYFFNSFFFRKLAEVNTLAADQIRAAFVRIEKWTKNVDIFDKEYIFIPVNQSYAYDYEIGCSLHWSLLIICHLNDLSLTEIDGDLHSSSTCILHLDSLEGSHSDIETCIRNYLLQEWNRRKGSQHEQLQYQFEQIKFIQVKVPQQDNLHDCGLFLLHYVELFLDRAFTFPRGRHLSFITRDWFKPADASAKRKQILEVIHGMYPERYRELGSRGDSSKSSRESPLLVDDDDLVLLQGSSHT